MEKEFVPNDEGLSGPTAASEHFSTMGGFFITEIASGEKNGKFTMTRRAGERTSRSLGWTNKIKSDDRKSSSNLGNAVLEWSLFLNHFPLKSRKRILSEGVDYEVIKLKYNKYNFI
ncbi:hypothetical protein [Sabulibacter ruber]|uniref:hypothetical protein n=1 Tax=Sabulibacter ruber TaxID=2811901 RepID=UPI001A976EC6|nr:hypothetical protein [Sabulibacter ruber]